MAFPSPNTQQTSPTRGRISPSIGGTTVLALLVLLTLAPGAAACIAMEAQSAARVVLREPVQRTIGIIRSTRVRTTSSHTHAHSYTPTLASIARSTPHARITEHHAPTAREWGVRAGIAAVPPPGE